MKTVYRHILILPSHCIFARPEEHETQPAPKIKTIDQSLLIASYDMNYKPPHNKKIKLKRKISFNFKLKLMKEKVKRHQH
ncbi:MAG: hypothetical protein ACI9RO_000046 [Alteromonas macleodii]|jgi:hypothetical protein